MSSEESSESEKEEMSSRKEGTSMIRDGVEDVHWFKLQSAVYR